MLIDGMLFDVAAHGADQRGLRISIDRLRTAAQAGAIAGLLGGERIVEKAYVLVARALRGTRRTAEYTRTRNAENKRAVERTVAIEDGLPAAGVDLFWYLLRDWLCSLLHCFVC
jgi:hypothetical protein